MKDYEGINEETGEGLYIEINTWKHAYLPT